MPSQELPVVGIPTLDVVAHPHMVRRMPIVAVIEAGRGRICVGHFVRRRGSWRRRGRYRLTTLTALCEEVGGKTLFCGELTAQDATTIRRCLGEEAMVASPASSVRRAAYLAELGWQRLARGDSDELAALSPIYLHNPQIDG
jgi:tRNA threonylcarbamoyladenosine biosynthesis protein TsaB